MHFCQGKLKRVNLIGKAKTCAEINDTKQSCKHHKSPAEKNDDQVIQCSNDSDHQGCCNNESFKMDLDTDFVQSQLNTASDLKVDFLLAFILSYFQSTHDFQYIPSRIYRPPLPAAPSLNILFQQFLI